MTEPIKTPTPYPSIYRYYIGAVGLGAGVGISWTLCMTTMGMQRIITKPHAIVLLYSTVALCFLSQMWLIIRWSRRLQRDRAEMSKFLQETANSWTKIPKN